MQVWEVKSNEVDIAVTPSSNKARLQACFVGGALPAPAACACLPTTCMPASPRPQAFIHWHVRGVQHDMQQEQEMYGLNLLVFDPATMLITGAQAA